MYTRFVKINTESQIINKFKITQLIIVAFYESGVKIEARQLGNHSRH